VVRTEVAVRGELGGVGLGPAQVRGVPPVEQTMRHKRARCAIGASCPHMGYKARCIAAYQIRVKTHKKILVGVVEGRGRRRVWVERI
jgi:hypothetical protein